MHKQKINPLRIADQERCRALRAMRVPAKAGLALLDLAPDVRPGAEDAVPKARRRRSRLPKV